MSDSIKPWSFLKVRIPKPNPRGSPTFSILVPASTRTRRGGMYLDQGRGDFVLWLMVDEGDGEEVSSMVFEWRAKDGPSEDMWIAGPIPIGDYAWNLFRL